MRRTLPMGLVAKFFAAFLVLLGTSGQGFASMLCGTPLCPKTVAAKVVPTEAESCCPTKAKAPEAPKPAEQDHDKGDKSCCCVVESGPIPAKLDSKIVLPTVVQLELGLPEPVPAVVCAISVEASDRIPSYSDGSPPDPGVLPDRGRAPPAA